MATSNPYVRALITGRLTTETPLHTSSGRTRSSESLNLTAGQDDIEIQIDSFPVDVHGRACIPGSTLKGVLRAWLHRHASDEHLQNIEHVFGSATQGEHAVGGIAAFHTVHVASDAQVDADSVPYWNCDASARSTGVTASVAVHRPTRTADHGKLYYADYIPSGVVLDVNITTENVTLEQLLTILSALDGFNCEVDRIRIGARTHDDWGRCQWELSDVAVATANDLSEWWTESMSDDPPLDQGLRKVLDVADLKVEARKLITPRTAASVQIEVSLSFDDALIVQDHSRRKTSNSDRNTDDHTPDAWPLMEVVETLNDEGVKAGVVLPRKSIRGVLRSQSERIAATLSPGGQLQSIIDHLFGSTMQRTTLRISEFIGEPVPIELREFVGIDRLTGGAAKGVKFNAMVAIQPCLTGTLTLRIDKLHQRLVESIRGANEGIREIRRKAARQRILAVAGLLALTLRDLVEGDLAFGFGAAKGFGTCRGAIRSVRVAGIDKDILSLLGDSPPSSTAEIEDAIGQESWEQLDQWLDSCLAALRGVAAEKLKAGDT